MKESYMIYLDEKPVGVASVILQGLYCCVSCVCELDQGPIYNVNICGIETNENLGVLVPEKGKLVLTKKIPVKKLKDKVLSFRITVREERDSYDYIPIDDAFLFSYIDRLEDAILVNREGKLYIRICCKD